MAVSSTTCLLSVARTAATLACLAFPIGVAQGQTGPAGAPNGFFPARNTPGAGGHSTNASVQVESAVGQATAGPTVSSTNFLFDPGVVFASTSFTVTGPVVFGVSNGYGDRLGGETETVVGFNFNPGVGLTTVSFDGVPGGSPTVVNNLSATAVSPLGKDTINNPLGPTSITVTNQIGSSTVADAYVYTPALLKNDDASIGDPYRIHYLGKTNDAIALIFGLSQPGISAPVAPFDGQFNLFFIVFFNTNFQLATNGSRVFTFTIPNDTAFIGFPFEFQGITIDSLEPLGGSFTNNLLSIGQE